MQIARHRLLISAIAAFALVSSANEVEVLRPSDATAGVQHQPDDDASGPAAAFDAWRAQAGYASITYVPHGSWEAVLREASR